MTPQVRVLDTAGSLAWTAAEIIVEAAQATDDLFSLALSGGSTPKAVHRLLAQSPFCQEMPWERTHLFWGDERNVPPDHADSNYRMAHETLLSAVPIPAANIHRIPAELPATEAATAYEAELRAFFGPVAWPQFNLVLLGLGDDSHTASLFPHTAALNEQERWVVANAVPKLNTERITLTLPVINHAQQVIFLVAGASKIEAVAQVLHGPRDYADLPAQAVAPVKGQLLWLLDRAAAGQ